MKTSKTAACVLTVLVCIFLLNTWPFPVRASAEVAAEVRIVPDPTHELLANPGMGWETFHRTRDEDENLPDWIPSTIHHARWGWGTLEPQPGRIDYVFLDGVLKETRQAGQRLAFRVMKDVCEKDHGE